MTALAVILTFAAAASPEEAHAQGSRFLHQPDVSSSQIVFVYANDLWIVPRTGGSAMRLTTSEGSETHPVFSVDGRWIAFSGQYGGNTDIYVIPTVGGEPRRLTWHPGTDVVQGWTPGGSVLFRSSREAVPTRFSRFYNRADDRWASNATGIAKGIPRKDVRRRRVRCLSGNALLGSGVAELPWRSGSTGQHRFDFNLGASNSSLDRRAPGCSRGGWTALFTICPSATGPPMFGPSTLVQGPNAN